MRYPRALGVLCSTIVVALVVAGCAATPPLETETPAPVATPQAFSSPSGLCELVTPTSVKVAAGPETWLDPERAFTTSVDVPDYSDDATIVVGATDEELPSFTSLQDAVDSAGPGSVIFVNDGVYDEQVQVNTGGTEEEPLVIVAESRDAVMHGTLRIQSPHVVVVGLSIDGSTGDNGFTRANGVDALSTNVLLSNIAVSNFQGWAVYFEAADPADTSQAAFATVVGSYFYNVSGGVRAVGETLVEGNEIERINTFGDGDQPGDAFRVFGTNTTFSGNYVHGSQMAEIVPAHADMIQSWDDLRIPVKNIVIENNLFTGWYNQGILLENDEFGGGGEYFISDWIVRGNIFEGYESWGVMAGKPNGGVPNMVVENNVFDGLPGVGGFFGIYFRGVGGTGSAVNNIVTNMATGSIGATEGASMTVGSNLTFQAPAPELSGPGDLVDVDPGFGDEAAFNFRPRLGAVTIDAGQAVAATRDANGLPRLQGPATDIGPYECAP